MAKLYALRNARSRPGQTGRLWKRKQDLIASLRRQQRWGGIPENTEVVEFDLLESDAQNFRIFMAESDARKAKEDEKKRLRVETYKAKQEKARAQAVKAEYHRLFPSEVGKK